MASFPNKDSHHTLADSNTQSPSTCITHLLICSLQHHISSPFTDMNSEKTLEDAIDLSHHLSAFARNRKLSPLKGYYKYIQRPGMISLAGGAFLLQAWPAQFSDSLLTGLPGPEYFPYDSLKANILVNNRFPTDGSTENGALFWLWNLFSPPQSTETISIPKYADKPQGIDIASSLQYSMTRGLPQLSTIFTEISTRIHQPRYANFTTLAHVGNTDGWAKVVVTLCNPNEGVLCDEWTYPSALAGMQPYGVSAIPVQMDDQGMCSSALREILVSWDEVARGMTRCNIPPTHLRNSS